ncbi:MAG: D-alanyl-D-alanine dipeptidase [Snowella sp.]|jgi:D-alanyl-D-alanine dipeptidase|nr:MAG: D-alanyl-D-alanine dipeptidase [Snowella sp.]
MKPYQQILIEECGDPLLAIALPNIVLTDPPPYQQLGADYQGKSPYCLRSQVIEALKKAQESLEQRCSGWKIQIFDAYRPVEVQQFMVDYTFAFLLQQKGLEEKDLSPTKRQELFTEVYKIWAIPSYDLATPPPHSTGSAMDITLVDSSGNLVDMGGEIDDLSDISQPNFYANHSDPKSQLFHKNRVLLNEVMESAGFLRHPGEWWHFSLGDQLWAWLYNQRNPQSPVIARYGRI